MHWTKQHRTRWWLFLQISSRQWFRCWVGISIARDYFTTGGWCIMTMPTPHSLICKWICSLCLIDLHTSLAIFMLALFRNWSYMISSTAKRRNCRSLTNYSNATSPGQHLVAHTGAHHSISCILLVRWASSLCQQLQTCLIPLVWNGIEWYLSFAVNENWWRIDGCCWQSTEPTWSCAQP